MEYEMNHFAWWVPKKLAWREGHHRKPSKTERFLSWPILDPYIPEPPPAGAGRTTRKGFVRPYYPLEEPTLFRVLAYVDVSEDGCLEFASKYGPLGGKPASRLPENFLSSDCAVFQDGDEQWYEGETLDRWRRDIEWMNLAVRVHDARQAKNRPRLLSVLKETYTLAGYATYDDAAKAPVRAARRLLHYVFTKFLPHIGLSVDRDLRRIIRPSSLRDALWLQFQSSIEEGRDFARCKHCNTWFLTPPQASGRKKFCKDSCRVRASEQRSRKQRRRASAKPSNGQKERGVQA
jgi:hypothetical protein